MRNLWAIILAAGKSTRMHKQKLLLPFQGETIIERVVHIAEKNFSNNIVMVLGSHSDEIRRQISNTNLNHCLNPDYDDGMLSSVICGFNALPHEAEAAMVFLGDQPHIPAWVPKLLTDAFEQSDKGIILPVFSGKRGHPILIHTRYRSEIEQLDPAKGLRSLMDKFTDDVLEVECAAPEIVSDIDTPADYINEINKNK